MSGLRRLAALGLALLLVACSAPTAHPARPPIPGGRATPGSAVADSPAPPADGTIEAFVPEAERFVEKHRGLRFKSHVPVTFLSDADFIKRLAGKDTTNAGAYAVEGKVLHALGLVEGHPDIARAESELQGSSVLGFYDPKTKELVVRGVTASPAVRRVVVHELTHALQDQYFGIDRTEPDDDEQETAFRSLVEGDAVRIERQYVASLTADEQRQVRQADAAGGPPPADVPIVLLELEAFPYVAGPRFTEAVVTAGGQDLLDAAFAKPPTTSAQLIHPDRFINGDSAPPVVDFPTADGKVIDKGVIGELGLNLILERLRGAGGVSDAQAQTVASGWAGDRYVAWEQGSGACVRAQFVEATPAATAALLAALRIFARVHSGTSLSGAGPITMTACA